MFIIYIPILSFFNFISPINVSRFDLFSLPFFFDIRNDDRRGKAILQKKKNARTKKQNRVGDRMKERKWPKRKKYWHERRKKIIEKERKTRKRKRNLKEFVKKKKKEKRKRQKINRNYSLITEILPTTYLSIYFNLLRPLYRQTSEENRYQEFQFCRKFLTFQFLLLA